MTATERSEGNFLFPSTRRHSRRAFHCLGRLVRSSRKPGRISLHGWEFLFLEVHLTRIAQRVNDLACLELRKILFRKNLAESRKKSRSAATVRVAFWQPGRTARRGFTAAARRRTLSPRSPIDYLRRELVATPPPPPLENLLMKLWLRSLLAAALLTGGFGFAAAEDKKKDKSDDELAAQFKKLDTNGNGLLVIPEYIGNKTGEAKTAAEKLFRRKDKDKDLQLTLAEFKREVAEKKKDPKKKKAPKKKAK